MKNRFVIYIFLICCLALNSYAQQAGTAAKDTLTQTPALIYHCTIEVPVKGNSYTFGMYSRFGNQFYLGFNYIEKTAKEGSSHDDDYSMLGVSAVSTPLINSDLLIALQLSAGLTHNGKNPFNNSLSEIFDPCVVAGAYLYYRLSSSIAVGIDGTYFAKPSKSVSATHLGVMLTLK